MCRPDEVFRLLIPIIGASQALKKSFQTLFPEVALCLL